MYWSSSLSSSSCVLGGPRPPRPRPRPPPRPPPLQSNQTHTQTSPPVLQHIEALRALLWLWIQHIPCGCHALPLARCRDAVHDIDPRRRTTNNMNLHIAAIQLDIVVLAARSLGILRTEELDLRLPKIAAGLVIQAPRRLDAPNVAKQLLRSPGVAAMPNLVSGRPLYPPSYDDSCAPTQSTPAGILPRIYPCPSSLPAHDEVALLCTLRSLSLIMAGSRLLIIILPVPPVLPPARRPPAGLLYMSCFHCPSGLPRVCAAPPIVIALSLVLMQ